MLEKNPSAFYVYDRCLLTTLTNCVSTWDGHITCKTLTVRLNCLKRLMSQLFGRLYIYCSIVYNIILGSDIQHDSIFF